MQEVKEWEGCGQDQVGAGNLAQGDVPAPPSKGALNQYHSQAGHWDCSRQTPEGGNEAPRMV